MTKACSFANGLPFCQSAQNTQSKQTNLSLGLRVSAVVLGAIALIASTLTLCGIIPLSNSIGWSIFAGGSISVILGTSIKCVNNTTDTDIRNTHADKFSDNAAKGHVSPDSDDTIGSEHQEASQQVVEDKKHKQASAVEEYSISERELQEGITISKRTRSRITRHWYSILHNSPEKGLKFYPCGQCAHRVFALDAVPGLIFKLQVYNDGSRGTDSPIAERYKSMVNALTVCRTHQLDLLVIPKAKLFTVQMEGKKYELIAEQKLDINHEEETQEQYYDDYADSLDKAIRQLAIFICRTGHSQVTWKHNSVLNDSLDEEGNRKFALVDVEKMDDAEVGLFGKQNRSRGLVGCVNERQGLMVLEVAKMNNIDTTYFAGAHERRKAELADQEGLKHYHISRNITRGDEPVIVDIETIDFPYAPDKVRKLREIAAHIIQTINTNIEKSSSEASRRERRCTRIKTRSERFGNLVELVEPERDVTYLGCVVNKLIELGHIYKFDSKSDHSVNAWLLQA